MSGGTGPWPVVGGERPFVRLGTADERTMLDGMLDWYRHSVVVKVRGVAQEVAGATPLPSATSIAGLVKHLALVEDSWYTEDFAGLPIPEPWAGVDWHADRDWEFHTAVANRSRTSSTSTRPPASARAASRPAAT